jgi:hypothetical protein
MLAQLLGYSNNTSRTMTNLFADADALEALKRSFAEQPNWKAAVVEGGSWGGTAAENIARYQELVGTPRRACTKFLF